MILTNKMGTKFNVFSDFGLFRLNLMVIVYNLSLCLFSLIFTGKIFYQPVMVILVHGGLILSREKILSWGKGPLFVAHALGLSSFMWFNYEVVGAIDRQMGGLPLYDHVMLKFDLLLFQNLGSNFIQDLLGHLGLWKMLVYDLLMVAYMSYYFFPFYVIYLFYREAEERNYYFLGRILSSIFSLYLMNFTLYLMVPVTGPQYYLKDYFQDPLPMTFLGASLLKFVSTAHPNFIDCFPSGHAGLAFLLTFWSYKLNFSKRHYCLVISLLIIISTVTLRFHYLLDILASLPLIMISYLISKVLFPWELTTSKDK